MAKLTVKLDGKVIGTRKTDRRYSHAVVGLQYKVTEYSKEQGVLAEPRAVEPRWVVCSYHATAALAVKASGAEYLTGDKKIRTFLREPRACFDEIRIVAVEG